MRHFPARELTVDEFEDRMAAYDQDEAIAAAADEEGGPRFSLVPTTEREGPWPTDLLPPASADAPAEDAAGDSQASDDAAADAAPADPAPTHFDAAEPVAAMPFDGVELPDSRKRLAGWSVERQRLFLTALAETGSVHLASAEARLSARSAYKLRARSPAFAAAWDTAEQLAVGRLAALAFDRAINGRTEQVWHQGTLVMEKRVPSDRLIMWLLARLDPRRFAAASEQRSDGPDPQAAARQAFPQQLDGLADLVA